SIDTGKQAWSELAGTAGRVSADANAPGDSWGAAVLARARTRTASAHIAFAHIAFNGTMRQCWRRVDGARAPGIRRCIIASRAPAAATVMPREVRTGRWHVLFAVRDGRQPRGAPTGTLPRRRRGRTRGQRTRSPARTTAQTSGGLASPATRAAGDGHGSVARRVRSKGDAGAGARAPDGPGADLGRGRRGAGCQCG